MGTPRVNMQHGPSPRNGRIPPTHRNHDAVTAPVRSCRDCPVCSQCPVGRLQSATYPFALRIRSLERGDHLYRSGDALKSLHLVQRGSLMRRMTAPNGSAMVLEFCDPGQVLGGEAIGSGLYASDAIALEATEVCELSYPWFAQLAEQHPALQQFLVQLLSARLAQTEQRLLQLGRYDAEQRLASWLSDYDQRHHHGDSGDAQWMDLPMSRQDLGDHLGTTLETVSRLLSRFRREHVIELRGRRICVCEPERLQRGPVDTKS